MTTDKQKYRMDVITAYTTANPFYHAEIIELKGKPIADNGWLLILAVSCLPVIILLLTMLPYRETTVIETIYKVVITNSPGLMVEY